MTKGIYVFIIALILISCGNNKEASESKTNGNVTMIDGDDKEINEAIIKARTTFNDFDTAFKNGHFDTSLFSLKVKFKTETGYEHMWATFVTFEKGNYYGVIDDVPKFTDKVKKNDRVKITDDNLSDWMYANNGILEGGFTIRVVRNKKTPEERAEFDSSFSLKIVD